MFRIFGLLALSFALLTSLACSKKMDDTTPAPQDTTKKVVYPNKLMGGVWKIDTCYYIDSITQKRNWNFMLSPLGGKYLNFFAKDTLDAGYEPKPNYVIYKLVSDTLKGLVKQWGSPRGDIKLHFQIIDNSETQFLDLKSNYSSRRTKDGDFYMVQEYYRYSRQK